MPVPPLLVFLFVVIPVSLTVYYGALISGLWKDPLIGRFRGYCD